ncbi:MAG: 3-isopropylmalate dehydratase [candidate division Zixibacteria bacterium]|nr:3-isopropylmalate dehydratase [candidate division Zixibacteria bacterium]MBU1471632.1 3-isopropylmalate dehydratase [candidate division Zixibacteria bacterium]
MEAIKGKIYKYGDDINTDVIFPGKYTYTVTDPAEMAQHAMEDLDPDFVKTVEKGDVVVGGKNFGCGSSREQAVKCLKFSGVGAVIAKTFSRIYFRNLINNGIPAIVNAQLVDSVEPGDKVVVDLQKGTVTTPKGEFKFPAYAPEIQQIINAGGLIPYTQKKLGIKP